VNCKVVSKKSWAFDPGEPADQLVQKIRQESGIEDFDLGIILGSGWSCASQVGDTIATYDYAEWPCFPSSRIAGHSGLLTVAKFSSWNLVIFSGRFHCYQGLSAYQAAFPVRLASALGCPRILLTCATGGINQQLAPGSFMLVDDHINLLGDNPLRGFSGDSFVDMTNAYHLNVYERILGREIPGLSLNRGILAAMPGPSYETPAEIRFLQNAGADVVSMSTVHETIMARYLDIQVAAIAFVANAAAGTGPEVLSHQDVLRCSTENARFFPILVHQFIECWQESVFISV